MNDLTYNFYGTEWIAKALLHQCFWRYMTVRFGYGLRRHYRVDEVNRMNAKGVQLWRPLENPFFEIQQANGDIENPADLFYYVNQGAVEFIPEVSTVFDMDRTDVVIIDLDPKGAFTWDDIRRATVLTHEALCAPDSPLAKEFVVENWKFRFSGNRSFHLYIKVQRPSEMKLLREAVKKSLDPLIERFPVLTYSVKNANDKILIDIGAIARHRCVRSLWSLHHKTGMVCVPIFCNIMEFDLREANPAFVLSRGPVQEAF